MARDDDFLLTDEELRLRNRRRRRRLVILILLGVLAIGGYFAARPTRDAIKGWQARRHAEKAFALLDQENWMAARTEAIAAFQLSSTEPQALRAIARLLSRTRQPEALEFWKRLADVAPLTPADRRDQAAIALIAGDTATAQHAIEQLTSASPTAADWLLAAQLALQKRAPGEARDAIAKIVSDPAASEREQLQASLLDLAAIAANPTAADAEQSARETWSRIERLAQSQSAAGLDALVVLARQLLGSKPSSAPPIQMSAAQLSDALRAHPLARAPQKLLALDLLEHEDASRHAELIERAVAEWKDAEPADLATLASWLNSKGEYQRNLDVIPIEKAAKSRDLFLQHVDALGALGRWAEIKQLLESDRYPLEEMSQRMYVARCNAQLGETAAAENNWQRALEAAGGEVGKLMTLADYAEKNGAIAIADRAYTAAAKGAPKLRAAQQGRLRIAQASRDTRKMHDVLATMLSIWPNDTAVQNDEAYTRLLLLPKDDAHASELEQIAQLAAGLVEKEPASLPHRTLLALVRLKQNRAADALAVYSGLNIPANALTPSALAVHAAVLSASGHPDDARTEQAQVAKEQLTAEERALIDAL